MSRKFSVLLIVTLLFISLLSLGATPSSAGAIPTEEDIKAILLDYSRSLSAGQVTKDSYYSPMMRDLLQDRRDFYKEFFDVGLHSDLLGIESDFTIESIVQDDERGNLYNVKATEMVILHGKYRCSSPEEYPLIKSGRWALARTADPAVKKAIEGYIESMVDGVNESIKDDGFDIAFVVRHELVVSNEKGLRIVQDSFTDAANDNPEGTDSVSWVNGRFVRRKPDLTKMPDYEMYNTPIEQLGESLLDAYSRIYGGRDTPLGYPPPRYHYYHSQAAAYINTWTKNTSLTCSTDPVVYQNQSNWNPAYQKLWCADCANYVSQALRAGGCTTTSTWQPYTNAWSNVYWLQKFLIDDGRGYWATSYLQLQAGDIAFIKKDNPERWEHVVMVAAVSPHRYSAHTSDRLKYGTWTNINKYMIMIVEPGG